MTCNCEAGKEESRRESMLLFSQLLVYQTLIQPSHRDDTRTSEE